MKRILILHPTFTVRGGAERKALVLAHDLGQSAMVEVGCFDWDSSRSFEEYLRGLAIKTFPPGAMGRMASLVRMGLYARRFDCVIAHNHPAQYAGWYRLFFKKPAFIWFCNETQLYLPVSRSHPLKPIFMAWMRRVDRYLSRHFSAVVANSQNTANLIAKHIGVQARVIYSGIDFSAYPVQWQPRKRTPECLKLIVVSRLETAKQLDRLLPVLNVLTRPYHLTIVGSGADERRLQDVFAACPVSWTGAVSESEKIRLLSQSDLFLFPTPDEPLGVAPIEAMACGLPVVAYRSGGVCETVIDGQTGYLVSDDAEFTEKISVLADDPQTYQRLSQAAFHHARKRFSVAGMGSQTRRLVEEVVLQAEGPV